MDTVIEDGELGSLIVRVNPRARSLVFRTKSDAVYVSVPPGTTTKEVKRAIENLRSKLLLSRQKVARPLIDLDYKIDAEHFKLSLILGEKEQFLANSRLGVMQIVCPPQADFTDENLQNWLRKVIEESLRRNAKSILPPRLEHLSAQCGLSYASVKINSSQGRWGSCSARKNISLSYYLVLLPSHLIDYVLLHELCHTREMNHGERFWDLLNRFTDGKALALRKELKKYRTEIEDAWDKELLILCRLLFSKLFDSVRFFFKLISSSLLAEIENGCYFRFIVYNHQCALFCKPTDLYRKGFFLHDLIGDKAVIDEQRNGISGKSFYQADRISFNIMSFCLVFPLQA